MENKLRQFECSLTANVSGTIFKPNKRFKTIKIVTCTTYILKRITLKSNLLKTVTFLILNFLLISFTNDPYSLKRISDKNFRYEFYTLKKEVKPKNNKEYFWFKGGLIHNAQSGIAGELLHGEFKKFYHSNQLAEQGKFKKGLRIGLWKTWYENGKLASVVNWSTGLKNGKSTTYNSDGVVLETGKFKKGFKKGTWIDAEKHDTLKFNRGEVVQPKPKKAKKVKEKKVKNNSKETKEIKANEQQPKEKKQGFFKRLFSKKDKVKTNDGKGA